MSIETKTFFKIFFFLIVVGIFISLLPGSTATMPTTMNLTLNATNLQTVPGGCFWGWLPILGWVYCAITDLAQVAGNALAMAFNFIYQGLDFMASLILFFTGISSVFSSTLLPSPLNFIVAVGIALGWLFLALDVASRVVGVIWGR
jgi:hypothetical protein